MTSRRRFIQIVPLVGASMLSAGSAWAQASQTTDAQKAAAMKEKWLQMSPAEKAAAKENARAKWDAMTPDEQAAAKRRFAEKYPQAADKIVNEKDAQAVALGYVSDAANANKSKYKDYAAGQRCSSCALYQGKESDAAAGCALFPGKQVAGKGWCSAYAKKA